LDSTTIQDYARRISADCARIDRIVRGLLDYSRPRAAKIESCDIRRLVEATIEMLSQQGAFKDIKLATYFEEMLPEVCVDPHQLQQVLFNLLLNSRDAMPAGGKLAVRVTADTSRRLPQQETSCLRVDVLDNGSGIPEEHLKRIFDPFFTTKPPGRGTGLGLAISARIIEGFGGRMEAQSRPGTGTRFSLWLPARTIKETAQ
jgi:hypothetical protein